ncbi:MAG: CoA-binding protein, partial [Pirellulales bacterium]|nr:CoA-binding protein [Pirellulales bacterium]
MRTENEGWLVMLEKLLKPDTVAVIGASRSPGKVGYEILENLIHAGFKGDIVPVNPKADTILNLPCFPNLKVYGKHIDLSVIAVPRGLVRAAVDESLAAGCGAICVITAGFKEVSEEGAKLEYEIAKVCTSHNVRLLGPNCLGLI